MASISKQEAREIAQGRGYDPDDMTKGQKMEIKKIVHEIKLFEEAKRARRGRPFERFI